MILAIAILIAISIGALLLWVFRVNVVPSGLVRQLQTFPTHGEITASDPIRRRQRQESSEKLKAILENLGRRFDKGDDASVVRDQLIHAGYTSPGAVAIYFGTRRPRRR